MLHATRLLAGALVMAFVPDASARPPDDIAAFRIDKSQNKNQVQYTVRVDDKCSPAGPAPVRAYWRMLERGPSATEPLTEGEAKLLGVERQDADGNSVRIVLRGFPSRPVTIRTERDAAGGCTASASMTIEGEDARLHDVYVKLSLFGVSYVQLTGWTSAGRVVRERLTP